VSASWAVDGLGPALVAFVRPCAGVEAVVVVDDVALGPAIGGVRMRPGITAGEVARLARAMTIKRARRRGPAGTQKVRRHCGRLPGGTAVPRDDIVRLDCELLIPAAQPDVVTTGNAGKILARVILEGATVQAEAQLAERGVLCVSDVVANSGGVINAAAEYRGAVRAASAASRWIAARDRAKA
jgi:glutamate dehydrogenase/leucine dehydrogenase